MNEAIVALIVGASVSSGWAGKPAAEIVSESLGLTYHNEARICHDVADDRLVLNGAKWVFNVDGFYHGSYRKDSAKEVAGVKAFFEATKGARVVMATVPLLDMGALNRLWCGSEASEQVSRDAINEAIRDGCKEGCTLIDADEFYGRFADRDDIRDPVHLTPEIWRSEAERVLKELR